jgi:hypothetical protein
MGFAQGLGAVVGGGLGFVATGFNPLGAAAGAAAGSSLGAGFEQSQQAKKQAKNQKSLGEQQLALSKDIADKTQQVGQQAAQQFNPFVEAGNAALQERQALLGLGTPEAQQQAQQSLFNTPGFQFQQQVGEKAVNRAAAARGRLNSGRTLLQLRDFNTQLASNAFNNRLNQLQLPISQGFGGTQGSVGALTNAQQQAGAQQQFGSGQNAAQQNAAFQTEQQGLQAGQQGITGAISNIISGAQIGGAFGATPPPQPTSTGLPFPIVSPNQGGRF